MAYKPRQSIAMLLLADDITNKRRTHTAAVNKVGTIESMLNQCSLTAYQIAKQTTSDARQR